MQAFKILLKHALGVSCDCDQVYLVLVSIARVQVSDGGTYTCVASNRAGVDNRNYNLQVYGETAVPHVFNIS